MGLFDSKSKSTSTNEAADWVQPHLTRSTDAYGNLTTPGAYGGNWQAGLNPMLSGAWGNMYGNQPGQDYMTQMGQSAGGAMDAYNKQRFAMDDMGTNPFRMDQAAYDQTMANLMPGIQGSYDAAARDIGRDLDWTQLPGMEATAAGLGLQGSTKLGQGSALAQGMASDRLADVSSGLYQNAANQAQNAAMTAGQQNLQGNVNLLDSYGRYGQSGMNNAFDMNQGMMSNQLLAGQGQQGYNQAGIDYNRQQFNEQQQNPWVYESQRLNNLSNVGNTFGTQTTSETSSPGLGNVALQLGSAYLGGGGGNPFAGMMGGGGAGGGTGVGSYGWGNMSSGQFEDFLRR